MNGTEASLPSLHGKHYLSRMTNPNADQSLTDMADRLKKMQRAIYYLIWRRTGFGEQCIHCGHSYPGHENKCKGAEIEELIR